MRRLPICRHHSPAAAALFIALFAVSSAPGQSFPYEARIAVPGAPVRSGPGDEFYITDTLPEGETVEVYRKRNNGWCAIRPTDGSFSWIYGANLHLLEDSLAEIDKSDVASRIGSRLSKQRNAVQVRLKKGEVVQVLGEADEGGQKWYKIAPPAGEFRWIHTSCIRREDGGPEVPRASAAPLAASTKPKDVMESEAPASVERPVVTVAATDETSTGRTAVTTANSPAQPAALNDWRAAPIAPPLATLTSPSQPAPPQTTSPLVASASAATNTSPLTSEPKPPIPAVADDLSRKLTDLELRLSRMVSEPPSTWQIGPLQNEAEQLLGQAQTVSDRDAVKVTLDKVDRFAAIQRRHQQLASAAPSNQQPSALPQQGQAAITPLPDAVGGQYDAVGVLRPVVSKRPGAPQFALIDQRGQVVSFVSPTPDLNLQPYVGHRVGIVGNRGFIPEFHRAHVTAGRVTPLDQNLVR